MDRSADSILTRRMLTWAFLADFIPLYPLYALFFTASGLSVLQISALFAIWSAVGIVAEVPTGALADRFSRRGCLVAAGFGQALGYACWVLAPSFWGFAAGFVLWGLGSVLASGAREALLYDGLAASGASHRYARVNGWVVSMGLLAEIPTALVATALFALGSYALVGWVSVALCLAAAVVALSIPEAAPTPSPETLGAPELGYLATIRSGLRLAVSRRGVLPLLLVTAGLGSLDALEEYFPLIVADLQVDTTLIPLAMLPIGLAGAVGAALGGRLAARRGGTIGVLMAASMVLLAAGAATGHPIGVLVVALFYGLYRAVLIVVDARLQHRIESASRATVTSLAGMTVDLLSFAVYAAWVLGGANLVAAVGLVLAGWLAVVLRHRPPASEPGTEEAEAPGRPESIREG
ncbi:MAG: MFS transporter [Propionibacteriaceae bacterium]